MADLLPITIAIPTYNRVQSVTALVKELLPQLSEVDELLVIEDGSPEKIDADTAWNARVRIVRFAGNQGMVKAWNACFEHALNDWICIIHDDDGVFPHTVETIRRGCRLAAGPGLVAHKTLGAQIDSGFRCHLVDPGPWPVLRLDLSPSGAAVHKTAVRDLCGFAERFKYSADVEFFGRIMARYKSVIIESPSLIQCNLHSANYQYRTWLEPDFLSQIEEIEQLLARYANLTPAQTEVRVQQRMMRYLTYMFDRAVRIRNKALIRSIGRSLQAISIVAPNVRLMAFCGATFGWVPPLGRID